MATSNTAIKITSLPNIGNNIAPSTLIPVVNMAGGPVTQKANLQITGNLILAGAGTANFVPAGLANLAYSVVNAAQPNITSTGTLNVNTLKVSGGVNGQYLQTDGTGNLTWVSGSSSGNGEVGGSNTQIQFNDAGNFGGNTGFTFVKTTGILAAPFADVSGVANIVGGGATVATKSVLNVASTFGSNSSAEPASAQAIRGRVTGANLTKTRNYVTGVTGQYLVTGTNASEFIKAGILGVVGDQTTTADGAVVAYLDGDGGLTTANAAYAVSMKNSTPNSGFNYGLDLQFINLNLGGVTTSTFKQADIRFNNGVTLVANTANNISINANVTAGNVLTSANVIANGAIESGTGLTTGGYLSVDGNTDLHNTTVTGYANVNGTANTVGGGATVVVRSILAIDSAFGSNDANGPASAQAVRGRVTGSNLTKTRNYVAGVTGQYLVTGTNASEFINTGLLGVVGDQTTTANAAVVAYLDGDGGLTTAGSAYGVSMKNSTPGSGFDYGLDLQFINLNVAGTTTPFKQADIRFNNGVELVANTANNISINANVTVGNITANNLGNISSINIDGSNSNVLYGNGVFAAVAGGGANTGNVTFNDINIIGTGNLKLQPDSANASAYLDIFLTAGPDIHIAGNGETVILGTDDYANVAVNVNGNVSIQANAGTPHTWNFGTDGTTTFPTANIDLHNGGVQSGEVLQFGNPNLQSIITGPTPSANVNAERLIIQGQRGNGTGEGGDVYVWAGDADTNGGDIKIYAGDADNVSTGSGGYVNIDGGAGFDNGGDIALTGGTSANGTGGYVQLSGGSGETDGGAINIQGGYSNGTGGTVGVYGGGAPLQASYGNVEIGSGTHAWLFDNTGNLTLPANTFAVNYANGTQVSIGGGNVTWAQIDDKNGNSGPTLIALGQNAGLTSQGVSAVAIGKQAGETTQGNYSVAVGQQAGTNTQGASAVAVGYLAGTTSQGASAVAIGLNTGSTGQGTYSVAIGSGAGFNGQGSNSVAIGLDTGLTSQGTNSVAIGKQAGETTQGTQSVAIGLYAGQTTQGTNSVAIGANAGITSQGNNSIILNATGANLNQTTANTFTVSPVRNDVANIAQVMFYNTSSKEITYGNTLSVAGNITGGNIITGGVISATGNANVGNIGSTDGVFTGNISGNTNGFTIGYLNIPQVAAANATLALTDASKHFYSTTAGNFTLTVPNNSTTSFATGTAISIVVQAAGNVLVNAVSGVTLYMAGNSTAANRVVGTYGMATLMKVATNTWFINGTGVS